MSAADDYTVLFCDNIWLSLCKRVIFIGETTNEKRDSLDETGSIRRNTSLSRVENQQTHYSPLIPVVSRRLNSTLELINNNLLEKYHQKVFFFFFMERFLYSSILSHNFFPRERITKMWFFPGGSVSGMEETRCWKQTKKNTQTEKENKITSESLSKCSTDIYVYLSTNLKILVSSNELIKIELPPWKI